MVTERRYAPPGGMSDFNAIEGQLDQWSDAISGWSDETITYVENQLLSSGEPCQYYNWLTERDAAEGLTQTVSWNALPKNLVRRFGHEEALHLADQVFPISQRLDRDGSYYVGPMWDQLSYRPTDEYCEWRTVRDEAGKITRIEFTAEPPEYWQALHGDAIMGYGLDGIIRYPFTGDRQLLVELYREHVDIRVRYEDLVAHEDLVDLRDPDQPQVIIRKGEYNPWNRWNTTDGLMHLSHPANTITAQIFLAAEATVLRHRAGRPVSDPDALICCAGYGGPMRHSDATIGASVNNLAMAGARLTLRDPVGLYLHHLDLTGITKPDGTPITPEYFRVLRGSPDQNLIERAVFEVPADDQPSHGDPLTVSDLTIAGIPIRYGSQVAERMTVALFATADRLGYFHNTPVACVKRCCQDNKNAMYLLLADRDGPCADGMVPAFDYPPEPPTTRSAQVVSLRHRAY
jgi:hypothetical protein